ncbi:MAG: alanine--glyoxylate aminotransferase family protein [Candidatus Zixiibacteriota bacterium]|nr:MAG: alanine--glyoxylate aminotransferase family protein [candidate division Zixibacteria bacterium]
MPDDVKIFLPGPTQVSPEVLAQLARPMIGHRTAEFWALMESLSPRLQQLLNTEYPVYAYSGTGTQAMEAALTNAGGPHLLILSNGLFGERWMQAAKGLGLKATLLDFGWGKAYSVVEIQRVLEQDGFSSVVMVHGETSTGMLNSIEPVSELVALLPDVLLIVDAVSTLGGVPLYMDRWGIDVLAGGAQKCLALPPGVEPVGVSQRALERARNSKRKGYASDFNLWQEFWLKHEVVTTPAIPQLFAMDFQVGRILEQETLAARWERHARMAQRAAEWAQARGWAPVGPEDMRLPSCTCLRPPNERDTAMTVAALRVQGYLIDAGQGPLKGRVLRLGHMGDWTLPDLEGLLATLDQVLK